MDRDGVRGIKKAYRRVVKLAILAEASFLTLNMVQKIPELQKVHAVGRAIETAEKGMEQGDKPGRQFLS